MGKRAPRRRRTPLQAAADRAAEDLAHKLGRMLRDARRNAGRLQREAAAVAGISRSEWSGLELGKDATLPMWSRAAFAVGSSLDAHLKQSTAAGQPRDAAHLRNQELVLRTAAPGGWRGLPEELIDRQAGTSRAADVLLHRARVRPEPDEYALFEIYDWFADVGAALRDWQRRIDAVERYAIARMKDEVLPHASGVWIVRATIRNRTLVREHATLFRSRFSGPGTPWLAALAHASTPMPATAALLWVNVSGDRIYPSRLG